MTSVREDTNELLLMLQAELRFSPKLEIVKGILQFGSYARGEEHFNDVDLVVVLGGVVQDAKQLVDRSVAARNHLEGFLGFEKTVDFAPVPVRIAGYFGIVQKKDGMGLEGRPLLEEEAEQVITQTKALYEHFIRFNDLPQASRKEYGEDKPPRDFRFNPDKTLWKDRRWRDLVVGERVRRRLKNINPTYDDKVREYSPRQAHHASMSAI